MPELTINTDKPETLEALKNLLATDTTLKEKIGLAPNFEGLDRAQLEKIEVEHKVNGKPVKKSLWDWIQAGTKADGADQRLQEAAEGLRLKEQRKSAQKAKNAVKAGKMPEDADLEAWADLIGEDAEDFKANIAEALGQKEPEKKGKKEEAVMPDATALFEAMKKAGMIPADMTPQDYAQTLALAKMDQIKGAGKALEERIRAAVAQNKELAKMIDGVKDDSKKQVLKDRIFDSARRDVRGRILSLGEKGTDEAIQQEIADAVGEVVKDLQTFGIPATAAPQPILLGRGEQGLPPVKVLSTEKVERPNSSEKPSAYDEAFVKSVMQGLAQAQEAGATSA